jgi:REP element-mobilizing transposase RayT
MKPPRGYEALRSHRISIPGARYFITLCTRDRRSGLNHPAVAHVIRSQLTSMELDKVVHIHAAVIMPDHFHALLTLGGQLAVGQIVGRLKSKTRHALRSAGLGWQGNFHEHRLRSDEPVAEVVHYLHLNPYRAGLCCPSETHTWLWVGAAEAEWFSPALENKQPYPEWLA